ncbi:NADPH-dependent FMN reductase [Aeromicrobium sp.]|uniref:NADPH-dependent FMN reductase n=1 Tax=Aeromicrobium sp. TaxID=1871063 RepID=UPI003D6A0F53
MIGAKAAGRPARTAVVVGNPKPFSRTLASAMRMARELSGQEPGLVVDLVTLGASLFDWDDPTVAELVSEVGRADLVVVGSPTYKGSYSGLLKLFLDRFATDGLTGVAVPLMLGAGRGHTLAPELMLRPVLTEIGATTVRGLYVIDNRHGDPAAYADWLASTRPAVDALVRRRRGASV